MGLEFDTNDFLHNLRATKPPYDCPFDGCNKTYKSYQGISFHLCNHHPYNRSGSASTAGEKKTGPSSSRGASKSPSEPEQYGSSSVAIREAALTYAEAQRMIEVEIDGRMHRININEQMDIIKFDKKNGLKDLPEDVNLLALPSSDPSKCDVRNENKSSSEVSAKNVNNDGYSHSTGSKKGGNKSSKSGKSGKKSHGNKSNKSSATSSKCGEKGQEEPVVGKLPEASFRVIEGYDLPDAPERPASYFRFIEKSPEELDESVEYDMDEEDCAWLDLINKKRKSSGQQPVPADTFELLMDRLEKESYFLSQNSGNEVTPAIDEDAVCCICNDGDCQNSNAILFCDMCDLAVHQECYGVPYIPEGQWLCRRCLHSPSAGVDCVLCPNKGGAFKQTDTSTWAHVVCALWIPEVCFANTVFLEPIDSIENIPAARWRLNCYICKQRGVGACIQCHKPNCYVAFHVTCAQQAGLFMKIEAIRELASGPVIRKAAYCHSHTPPDENGTSLSGVYNSGDDDSRSSFSKTNQKNRKDYPRKCLPATSVNNDAEFKEKIRKTRKILAEKRSATPNVSIPTIPSDRLTAIAEKITFPKRNQFIQRLIGYWTLKRQSRNGVPLLRRLQISYNGSRRGEGSGVNGHDHDGAHDEAVKKIKEEVKYWQRLRQDLEKARLLVELIRKREKLKLQLIETSQQTMELHLQPFKRYLHSLLTSLQAKDTNRFFTDPVDVNEVPDYLDFIPKPMDLTTMRSKVESNEYSSLNEMEDDFDLIITNCTFYNDPETIYYKAAVKLKESSKPIWKEARERVQVTGYDQPQGLHHPLVPGVTATGASETSHPKETEDEGGSDEGEDEVEESSIRGRIFAGESEDILKDRMQTLENELSRAYLRKSGGSRSKKIREIKAKILSVNSALHELNPVIYPLMDESSLSPTKKYRRRSQSQDSQDSAKTPRKKVKESSPSKKTPVKEGVKKTLVKEGVKKNTLVKEGVKKKTPVKGGVKKKSPSKKKPPTPSESESELPPTHDSDGESTDVYASPTKSSPTKSSPTKSSPTKSSPMKSSTGSPTKKRKDTSVVTPSKKKRKLSPAKSEKGSSPTKRGRSVSPSKSDAAVETPVEMFSPTQQLPRDSKAKKNSSRKKQPSSALSSNVPQTDSFKVYRSQDHSSSDSESKSNSSTSRSNRSPSSLTESKPEDEEEEDRTPATSVSPPSRSRHASSNGSLTDHMNQLPLLPEDLVWAKNLDTCNWFPGMIVRVKGNRARIKKSLPVPPGEILRIGRREKKNGNDYLVNYFNQDSTWMWLPRSHLEPLGAEDEIDQNKIKSIKKLKERKEAREAYERAIVQRIETTGQVDSLISEDEDDKEDEEAGDEDDKEDEEAGDEVESSVEESEDEAETKDEDEESDEGEEESSSEEDE